MDYLVEDAKRRQKEAGKNTHGHRHKSKNLQLVEKLPQAGNKQKSVVEKLPQPVNTKKCSFRKFFRNFQINK